MTQASSTSVPTTLNEMSIMTSLSAQPQASNQSACSFDERMQYHMDNPMQASMAQYKVQTQIGKQGEQLSRPQYRMWLINYSASAYII